MCSLEALTMVQQLQKRLSLFDLDIDNLSLSELLAELKSGIVFTPNVDHVMRLKRDQAFRQVYSIADYRLCDSKILMYAARFLGKPIREKLSGSDLFPAFYRYHRDNLAVRMFLLGAEPGVAAQAALAINTKVGREMVVGTYSPTIGFEQNRSETAEILERVRRSGATVLAIGLGSPKQETWIYQHRQALAQVKIFFAIGATIDFEAGYKPRAPKWTSDVGLEWFYRLLTEPRRLWKRYLFGILPFAWLVLKEKFSVGR
jgi:N-acetylglucosaminyldiphosphoundecaprenol N-acetyl-beta-D-mannosaminyltransferase